LFLITKSLKCFIKALTLVLNIYPRKITPEDLIQVSISRMCSMIITMSIKWFLNYSWGRSKEYWKRILI